MINYLINLEVCNKLMPMPNNPHHHKISLHFNHFIKGPTQTLLLSLNHYTFRLHFILIGILFPICIMLIHIILNHMSQCTYFILYSRDGLKFIERRKKYYL